MQSHFILRLVRLQVEDQLNQPTRNVFMSSASNLSDSESEADNHPDIMSLFASGDEGSFSGFSQTQEVTEAVTEKEPDKKRKLKSVIIDAETVKKNKKAHEGKQTVENNVRGPGKGPGKNRKGKAPAKKRSNDDSSKSSSVSSPTLAELQEYREIKSKLQRILDAHEKNETNTPDEPEVEENMADDFEETEPVDVRHFNVFEDVEADEINNNDTDEEFLYAIPKIFEDDEKFGEDTNKSIAKLINTVASRKSLIDKEVKDYKIPGNCKVLFPPKVNPEIWFFLSRQGRGDDLLFQTIQKILSFGIVPVIRTAEILSKNDASKMIPKMRSIINSALSVLCAAYFEVSFVRRMMLKPNIDQKYHQLCTRNLEVTDFLFGDDVSKKVKDINDAQKMKGLVSASSKNWRPAGGCSFPGCNYANSRGRGRSSYNQRGQRGSRYSRGRASYMYKSQRGKRY